MFVDTEPTEVPDRAGVPDPELHTRAATKAVPARLRVYIGAAAGVGKTFQMLEDANALRKQGVDVVLGIVETHGRAETAAQLTDLEVIPPKKVVYRGTVFNELDIETLIRRKPAVALIDELAHSNIAGSKNDKRYLDVLELLESGISVITAVNIQHIESLNDVVARITGVVVRETVPDCFFRRADEVIDVDVSIDTLRTRIRQGKIYRAEKIEQALHNFFRKGNLAALRELALRQVALHQSAQDHDYRDREGLERAVIPEKVMVCMASRGSAQKLLRIGSRIAGRLSAGDWTAVYVRTPREAPGKINPKAEDALRENVRFAETLGARVVELVADNIADALLKYARDNAITHVIFGQSARSRWQILFKGSIINRFLREVEDVAVHVIPLSKDAR